MMAKNFLINKKNNDKNGVIIIVVLMLLTFLLALGMIYYQSSMRSTTDILYKAEVLKARNLARAGYEKALLWVYEYYHDGNLGKDLKFDTRVRNDLKGELASGKYYVKSIETVEKIRLDKNETLKRKFQSIPYVLETGTLGRYDIVKILSVGEAKGISIEMETLVKVIVEEARY